MPRRVVRSAPRKSTASAISSDDRAPAPSVSIAAVRLAMPNLPGRIVGAAAQDDQVDLRDRHLVQLDDPDRQAVRQLPLLDRRAASARGGGPGGGRLAAIGRLRAERPTSERRGARHAVEAECI